MAGRLGSSSRLVSAFVPGGHPGPKRSDGWELDGFNLKPKQALQQPRRARAQVRLGQGQGDCALLCLLSESTETEAQEGLILQLAVGTPELYQTSQVARQAQADVEKFATALDLALVVNAEERFLAALALQRLGLAFWPEPGPAWAGRERLRPRRSSAGPKVDRGETAAAKALEVAMEALDQDDEVVWPAPEEATVITRDHERFSRDEAARRESSSSAAGGGEGGGGDYLRAGGEALSQSEVQQLRLISDLAARRLLFPRQRDRWFRRAGPPPVQQLAKVLGAEHTGASCSPSRLWRRWPCSSSSG